MEKPQYEYGALCAGIKQCERNIEAIREALQKEEALLDNMKYWKRRHEEYREYLKEHPEEAPSGENGNGPGSGQADIQGQREHDEPTAG